MVPMITVDYIRAFEDNYIWAIHHGGRECVLVDPGDAGPVMGYLEETGRVPSAVLVTHHHGDHTGGLDDLAARFDLEVYGPRAESIPGIRHKVAESDVVELPAMGIRFRVLDTPGHTRGHVCYTGHGLLFCGDTLFGAGCGRLFEGTPEQMFASLEKIRALGDETLVYCAHEYTLANLKFARVVEPKSVALRERESEALRVRSENRPTVPSRLGVEKQTNPFLRCQVPEVISAAEQFAGRPLARGAEVFAVVRYWKDTLD